MKDSLVIVGFFALGVIAGLAGVLPEGFEAGKASMYVLYLLMALVGLGIGSDEKLREILSTLRPKFLLVPLGTVVGTLAFSAAASLLFRDMSVADGLAVGSGFTYYSLSSVLITQLKAGAAGAELGTVALLTNVIKEIAVLVGAPLMVRVFGPTAPISAGGAATMDTLLPSIVNASGKEWTFVAILHGVLVDFSVPLFVTFFCSL